jgi:hypothetical protein
MAKKVVPGSITKAYQKREGDFSPDLVGFQFTKSTSLFTLGNFSLTTNTDSLTGAAFNTGVFSEPYTLESLDLTDEESATISENSSSIKLTLNNDKSNFLSYVYFGSATKFIETEITDIITLWKGSIYLKKSTITTSVSGYTYNNTKDTSKFIIPTSIMNNVFNLDTSNDSLSSSDPNNISSIVNNFTKYEIDNEYGEFKLIGYTGDTSTESYVIVEVDGESWPTLSGTSSGSFTYHLRPTDETLDKIFFNRISDFQNQILNRLTTPKYTVNIKIPYNNSLGYTTTTTKRYTWPTTDGYNLDINGRDYLEYLQGLFDTIKFLDSEKTNIMTRRLVSTSILEFDTAGDGTNSGGRKMDKMLKIWGREFDEVKKYIDGISFANVLTYDGEDNMPDELVKILASNLGFDTIQSFSDNNLINYLVTTTNTIFSGDSRSLSIKEMDTELWKRLVINAWWLFKSKGTRKVIEFFLNLFRIDECLVDLNECVYLVDEKLDYTDTLVKLNEYFGIGGYDIDDMPIDDDGYPRILPNSPDYYFQMNGFWYDGGVPANTIPDTNGNNPHFGPYDFGKMYFDRFRCFIGDFIPSSTTLILNDLTFNYFTDYSLGTVEGTGSETTTLTDDSLTTVNDGNILTTYNTFYGGVMDIDRVTSGTTITNAGSTSEQSLSGDSSFKITFFTGDDDSCRVCPPNVFMINSGEIGFNENLTSHILTDEVCCEHYGYNTYLNINNGQTTCYWCPPVEYFESEVVQIVTTVDPNQTNTKRRLIKPVTYTQIMVQTPEGDLETPTKACCELRGYKWDKANSRCVPQPPPIVIGGNGGTTTNPLPNNSNT